jgi:signal transduction histidine kinase
VLAHYTATGRSGASTITRVPRFDESIVSSPSSSSARSRMLASPRWPGFDENNPIPGGEPGHLGLASMRERAELMDGTLEIESSDLGTRVLVLAPLHAAKPRA